MKPNIALHKWSHTLSSYTSIKVKKREWINIHPIFSTSAVVCPAWWHTPAWTDNRWWEKMDFYQFTLFIHFVIIYLLALDSGITEAKTRLETWTCFWNINILAHQFVLFQDIFLPAKVVAIYIFDWHFLNRYFFRM